MEQKSDVIFRAEKIYKNSREKFGFLIREIVSNSIHAAIIRKCRSDQKAFVPKIEVKMEIRENDAEITVVDNGEGFNEFNRRIFTHLDMRNSEKERLNLHPKGQGRLAIIYFSDTACFTSVFNDSSGKYKSKSFYYPEAELSLFDIENAEGTETNDLETFTKLELKLTKPKTFSRAKTFFSKYCNITLLKNWFIENFFPFFMEYKDLLLEISFNEESISLDKSYIEKNVISIPFSAVVSDESETKYDFNIWLAENAGSPKTRNPILCFARHLRAEIENGKLEYEIDLPCAYDWLLTSEYFDNNVDQKGDKIEISTEDVLIIQSELCSALDKHFASEIEKNRKETKSNIETTKAKYNSLAIFVDETKISGSKTILREQDIVNNAIESKGKIEKAYWTSQNSNEEDVGKLINSSLQIYVDHRGKVLRKFHMLIKKFNEDGEIKPELEDTIHDLLMKRGANLRDTNNINQMHNLWILDDKYAIFSDNYRGQSTRSGQGLSDIYLWVDDPKRARELLILELKSTTNAHNSGNKYESMVAQVKRYASQFYQDPEKTLNWNINTEEIMYSGIILARKSDIFKELTSNNIGGHPMKIPFLQSSYYFNENFSISGKVIGTPSFKDIRIEMYSYEDIHELATNRNEVFLNLLNGEFCIHEDE